MQPKLTETEAIELKLDSYMMQIHHTTCLRCKSGEQYSQLFEVWIHPIKTRHTGYRDLRPATQFLRDLPMSYIELPTRAIPICSDCVHTYQCSAAPIPANAASNAAWAETLKRKYAAAPVEIKIARASQSTAGRKDIPAPTAEEL